MESTKQERQTVTLKANDSIDAACKLYEDELQRGGQPCIEDYLAGWEEPERSKLLFELLRLELQYGVITGATASRQDFIARFPSHKEVVEEAFVSTLVRTDSEERLSLQSELVKNAFVGQGGLGIVYVAHDQELQRDTAVKFIQDNIKDDARSQEQFRLEATITGRLEHPGIVPVHGMGETADGRLFYVMRLIRGERLDEAIAKYYEPRPKSSAGSFKTEIRFHELLTRFAAVCKTIAYAHNRGVIHRDIKPGNIMLGRFGETIVIDWGLGAHVGRTGIFKDSGEKTLMPSSGSGSSANSRGGTPPYMSPEQAAGRENLGPTSDIYSLGATFYTLLTNKIPFIGSPLDVMNRVMRGAYTKPSEENPNVSKALEAICMKAMSLDPQRRYATALEMADDIECFLADAPVKAYDEPWSRRVARWARRHRSMAQTGILGLVLLAVAGSTFALLMSKKAATEQALHGEAVLAQQQAEEAQKKEQDLRKHGLQLSALFAARTIANQVDLRWRILEKEASDPNLHDIMMQVNSNPQKPEYQADVQKWIESRVADDYSNIRYRTWVIYAKDGTQVARKPMEEDGQKASSLGGNFAYRDYFNGRGHDFSPDDGTNLKPLTKPHNSTVIRSTVDGLLAVMLSVPIRMDENAEPQGVLGMTIELGSFADLQLNLPEGQGVLLVESRKYHMLDKNNQPEGELGDGLVLHHRDLADASKGKETLPHLSGEIVEHIRHARELKISGAQANNLGSLMPDSYQDPLCADKNCRWIAAFEPVLVESRPKGEQDTGWFVIVQQLKQ